jgi:hypothetical protein
MNVQPIIDELKQSGIVLEVLEGSRLHYRAPKGALTPALKETIRLCKPWIMLQLHAKQERTNPQLVSRRVNTHCHTAAWDATDWQEYFDERAGIYEYDGKLSRPDAERQAFDACISHWMNKNPPAHTDINTCPQCNGAINVQLNNSTAILIGNGGHIWLHDKCWAGCLERRKAEAISVLRKMSIYASAVAGACDVTNASNGCFKWQK